MERVFLRSYQIDAIMELVSIFESLGKIPRGKKEETPRGVPPWGEGGPTAATGATGDGDGGAGGDDGVLSEALRRRVTIVSSPTASGKTLIMKGFSDQLAERGFQTIVLTYSHPVAEQNRRAGLNSATVQKFFHAFETARERNLRGEAARAHVAVSLGLPQGFFEGECAVVADESHLGLENMSKIYDKTITFLRKARMIVGFTATPRWREYFHTIDLTPHVVEHVAPPRGSILFSQSILSLPMQATILPGPRLVFTRSVASAALITLSFNALLGRQEAALIVSNGRKAIEDFFVRYFLGTPGIGAGGRSQGGDDGGGDLGEDQDEVEMSQGAAQGGADGAAQDVSGIAAWDPRWVGLRGSFAGEAETAVKVDLRERRLGVIVLYLLLSRWAEEKGADDLRDSYLRLNLSLGGVPRFAEAVRLVRRYMPDLVAAFMAALTRGDRGAVGELVGAAVRSPVLPGATPAQFAAGKVGTGVSVYKIAAGFNLPALRTVIFAEQVVGSRVLYQQRAGRGARKIPGKGFYDLVEFRYADPFSDGVPPGRGVHWTSIFVSDPARRREIVGKTLIFREECAKVAGG